MDTLGKRLKALRGERTQVVVAEATGVDRSHLSSVENDKAQLSLDAARAMADYYSVSLEWLIEGRGPQSRDPRHASILAALDSLPPEERESYLRLIFARACEPKAAAS